MPFGRALGKGAYEFADTALLGALPESWDPGAETGGEEFAGSIGGLLGLAGPAAVGYGVGRGISRAAKGYRALHMGDEAALQAMATKVPSKYAAQVGKVMDSAGAAVVNRLRRLRKLIETTENPKLKNFYRTLFRSTLVAAQTSARGVSAGAGFVGRNVVKPAAMAAGKYPRVTQWGTAIPTALVANDFFNDDEYYAPETWGE